VTGDLIWEYRRDRPGDLGDYMIRRLIDTNGTSPSTAS